MLYNSPFLYCREKVALVCWLGVLQLLGKCLHLAVNSHVLIVTANSYVMHSQDASSESSQNTANVVKWFIESCNQSHISIQLQSYIREHFVVW